MGILSKIFGKKDYVKYVFDYKFGCVKIPNITKVNFKIYKDKLEISPSKMGMTYCKFEEFSLGKEIKSIKYNKKEDIITIIADIEDVENEIVLECVSDIMKDSYISTFINKVQQVIMSNKNM